MQGARRGGRTAVGLVLAAGVALGAVGPASVDAAGPVPRLPVIPAASTATPEATDVIVRYRTAAGAGGRANARAAAKVTRVREVPSAGLQVVRPVRGQTVDDAIAALNADPAVAYAEPDAPMRLAADPGAEPWRVDLQWGLENLGGDCLAEFTEGYCRSDADIDATGGWAVATGEGVTVAVLDDGLDFSHPELEGRAWVNPGESGPDGLGGDRETNGLDDDGNGYVDDVNGVNLCGDAPTTQLHVEGADWHGTAVASVLGAATNGIALAGVAPDARLMAVRWLVAGECESTSAAIAAIDYAIDNGADVINASWGSYSFSSSLLAAVERAHDAGILIVAAAGNDGVTNRFYPAGYDASNILSVGAMAPDGYLADFSNRGTWVDIAAPGARIAAAYVASGEPTYALVDGTSFAAPHVAGIAALLAEVKPSLLDDAVAMRIKLVNSGWINTRTDGSLTLYGRIADAAFAVDVTPPSAPGSIGVKGRTNTTIGSSVRMSVTWGASFDASGIDSYRVRYRPVASSTWTTLASATTARSIDMTLRAGTAYEVLIAARDRGGNYATTIVPVTPTVYSESSSRATYGGTWGLATSSAYSGGKARFTGTAGRSTTFAITGRSFAWVAAKGPTRGSAKVYVDGVYRATVNLHSSSTAYRRIVFSTTWTSVGDHVVRIVASGTKGHPRVDVDAAVVAR